MSNSFSNTDNLVGFADTSNIQPTVDQSEQVQPKAGPSFIEKALAFADVGGSSATVGGTNVVGAKAIQIDDNAQGGDMTYGEAFDERVKGLQDSRELLNDEWKWLDETADVTGALAGLAFPPTRGPQTLRLGLEAADMAGKIMKPGLQKFGRMLQEGFKGAGAAATETLLTGGDSTDAMWAAMGGGGLSVAGQGLIGDIVAPMAKHTIGGSTKNTRRATDSQTGQVYTDDTGISPDTIIASQMTREANDENLPAIVNDPPDDPGRMVRQLYSEIDSSNVPKFTNAQLTQKGSGANKFAEQLGSAVVNSKRIADEHGAKLKQEADTVFNGLPTPRDAMLQRYSATNEIGEGLSQYGKTQPSAPNGPPPPGAQLLSDTNLGTTGKETVEGIRQDIMGTAQVEDFVRNAGPGTAEAYEFFRKAIQDPTLDYPTLKESVRGSKAVPKEGKLDPETGVPRNAERIATINEFNNSLIPDDMQVADLYRASQFLNTRMKDMDFQSSQEVGWLKVKAAVDKALYKATGDIGPDGKSPIADLRERYAGQFAVEGQYDIGSALYRNPQLDLADVTKDASSQAKRKLSIDDHVDRLTVKDGDDPKVAQQKTSEMEMFRNGFMNEMSKDWASSTPKEFFDNLLGEVQKDGSRHFFDTNSGRRETLTKVIGEDNLNTLLGVAKQYDKQQMLNALPELLQRKMDEALSETDFDGTSFYIPFRPEQQAASVVNYSTKKAAPWFDKGASKIMGASQIINADPHKSRRMVIDAMNAQKVGPTKLGIPIGSMTVQSGEDFEGDKGLAQEILGFLGD